MIILFWRTPPADFDDTEWPALVGILGVPSTFTLVSLSGVQVDPAYAISVTVDAGNTAPVSAATTLLSDGAGFVSVGRSGGSVSDFDQGGGP